MIGTALSANAQSVSLSQRFGVNGSLSIPGAAGGNDANSHVFTADGHMIVAGDGYDFGCNCYHVTMAKFDTVCGALDPGCGTAGIMSHIHEGRTSCGGIALQPDGKIVGCGTIAPGNDGSAQVAGVYRFNADGTVDSTFNGTGYVRQRFDPVSSGDFFQVFVNADSTITCAGASSSNSNGGVYAVGAMRFNYDGTLDTTFSADGIATSPPAGSITDATVMSFGTAAMDASGRLIVAGSNYYDQFLRMVRFMPNGDLDTTFGSGGIVTTGVGCYYGGGAGGYGLTVLPDGRILFSSQVPVAAFMMARFLEDGTLDTSFGTGGMSTVPVANGQAYDHAVLPDGGSLQFGRSDDGYGTCLRRDADGQVVATYGTNGFGTAYAGDSGPFFRGGALLPSGRVVGYGGYWPGLMLVAMLTTEPEVDALPVISQSGTDLVTTGTGDFQWFLDGSPISGATDTLYTPIANGDYTVVLTVSPDCIFTSPVYTLLNVGVEEFTVTGLYLITNPVNDVLRIVNDGATTPCAIVDAGGRTVMQEQLFTGANNVDLSSLRPGLYLLRTAVGAVRFVKE